MLFVSPSSFVILMVTKSLCDCSLSDAFSEFSSLGSGSSSGLGFRDVGSYGGPLS